MWFHIIVLQIFYENIELNSKYKYFECRLLEICRIFKLQHFLEKKFV